MSVPPVRRLPERPSLEQLLKQAKEHLDTLRAADASATLAAAQHALAREYGFDSWPKLVHHVETLQPHRRMLRPAELKSAEKLTWSSGRGADVWALFQACAAGDLPAVQTLMANDRTLARAHYDYPSRSISRCARNRVDARFTEHDSTRWICGWTTTRPRSRATAAIRRWSDAGRDARHEVQRVAEG
jgi:hypothetical protein